MRNRKMNIIRMRLSVCGLLLGTALVSAGCSSAETVVFEASCDEQEDVQSLLKQTYPKEEETRRALKDDASDRQNGLEKSVEDVDADADADADRQAEMAQESIYVQVCGQVHNPGVYKLNVGERIFRAIELAGGVTDEAQVESINQAAKAQDGQMIYVCSRAEWEEANAGQKVVACDTGQMDATAGEERININMADESELKTIAGIGDVLAGRIVSYRETNGAFQTIEDIKKVSGIGENLFQKIKDRIRV